jgi:hypothetical protein
VLSCADDDVFIAGVNGSLDGDKLYESKDFIAWARNNNFEQKIS